MIKLASLRRITLLFALIAIVFVGSTQGRATSTPSVTVTVKAGKSLGTIPTYAIGLNTAAWDPRLTDSQLPGLLKQVGITMMRFPGGVTADTYHWQSNSLTPAHTGLSFKPAAGSKFDALMDLAQHTGAKVMITVNYGTNVAGTGPGDPNEAAAWVKYANVTKHYGIKYWEIGNEVYGDGFYGPTWETDLNTQKGPTAYATSAVSFTTAMKAVDPSIKVGLVLATPGYFPDGKQPDWNSGVLSTACSKIDFVILHYYPQRTGQESDAGLLSSTDQIASMENKVQAQIKQYCGSNAKHVQIMVTETNSVAFRPGKQTVGLVNALFLVNNFMAWLENGAANVDWWDLHLPFNTRGNTSATLYGSAQYGDHGILSSGSCSPLGICEPAAETPFPTYYGLKMLTILGKPGDTMVTSSSSQSMIVVHAVKQAKGNLAVLLTNRDPSTAYKVSFTLGGYTPANKATLNSYRMSSSSISSSTVKSSHNTFTLTVAPYSLTTLVMTQQKPPCKGKNCNSKSKKK